MLAWMGGKRSKLKTAEGRVRQTSRNLNRTGSGNRIATPETQRLNKQHEARSNAFQQLCDAAQGVNQDHPSCRSHTVAPLSQLDPVKGFEIPHKSHPIRILVNKQDQMTSGNLPNDLLGHDDKLEEAQHKWPTAAAGARDNISDSDVDTFGEDQLSEAKKSPIKSILPQASGLQQVKDSERLRSRPDMSLDLQGIALQI